MTDPAELRARLLQCPPGRPGWKTFEDAYLDTLRVLFVPPLTRPVFQARTYSGIDRRDAVFPNRNLLTENNWRLLYHELGARMILFEFKNYDKEEIGKEEINQTRSYLSEPMGRLAIVCSSRLPNRAAHIKRNSIFSEERKVILFVTTADLVEMLALKERGEDPSVMILDLIEAFYLQHE